MTRGTLARYAAIVMVAAAVSGLVVHGLDNRHSSPTSTPAPLGPAEDAREGCEIVMDTMRRAEAEATQQNSTVDLSKLAHPYHLQDMWNPAHQADLDHAVTQLGVAAQADPKWQLLYVAVQASSAATAVGQPGPLTFIALTDAQTACTAALSSSRPTQR